MLIYISYNLKSNGQAVEAQKAQAQLEEAGHSTIMACNLTYNGFEKRESVIIRCDGIYIIGDYTNASVRDIDQNVYDDYLFASEKEIPIYIHEQSKGTIERSVTEIDRPRQCESFLEIIMKMYRIHLKKNADYSSANILGTGSVGVVVRMWDKMARVMNLSGFNLRLAEPAQFDDKLAKKAQNEPLEDSFWDISVYAIIKILLDRGVWGR